MFHSDKIEDFLRASNKTLERLMPLLTPTGVILGLILGNHVAWMKPAVTYLFAFLTLVNGMGVSINDFCSVLRRPKPILAFGLCTYILMPLLVTIIGNLFFPGNNDVITGYLLLYCIPSAVVACVWSGIYKGNMALSLSILVLATCLAPFITPASISLLAHSDIQIDTKGMVISLFTMVVIPSIIGIAINAATKGKCNEHLTPSLKPFTKIALLFVIIINTSQVAERLIQDADWIYIPEALTALLLTTASFFLSYLVSGFMKLKAEETVSVVYASGMRNISAALVLAIDFFPPAAAIPVISGIVLQQTTCAIISHFLFGAKPEKKTAILGGK